MQNKYPFALVALVGATMIGACSMAPPAHMMDVQQGETFTLKQSISIPAEKARSYIQFGKLTGSGFNQREQHCRIEIKSLQPVKTEIQPGEFEIVRVQIGEEQIAQNQPLRSLPAGTQLAFVGNALAQDDYQRPETMDYVHLYLKSNQQPNVYRLTCAGALSNGDLFDAPRSYRPQKQQINQILGEMGEIR